jgi:hypothetical protein
MSQYIIRKMKEAEVQLALDWARKEGWNPGLNDANCFYQADPNGFFIGLLDNEPIAAGSAVIYSNNFAFCGLYIVKEEFRKKGYGLKLTEERLKYVGNRITGIDGVLNNVSKYERIGYVPSHKQIRYEWTGQQTFSISPNIVDIKSIPFKQLEDYDKKYFQAPRPNFLRSWIHQPNCHAAGYLKNQQLEGYGVIRKCYQGYKIGPLFAGSPMIAHAVFEALCMKAGAGPIYLDIPEPNKHAQSLVKNYKMTPKFEVIRMYRNGMPEVNLEEGVYGITTFELG